MALQDALQIVCQTDTGRVREHNEDSVDLRAEVGLVVLADGMGGYNAGEVASEMTTSSIVVGVAQRWTEEMGSDHERARALLQYEISVANIDVFERAQTDSACEGMGTTVLACLFHDNILTVGHLGDSRLYCMRGDKLRQVTHDHSVLQEQIDLGLLTPAEARLSTHKNLVTRALGIEPDEQAEINQLVGAARFGQGGYLPAQPTSTATLTASSTADAGLAGWAAYAAEPVRQPARKRR